MEQQAVATFVLDVVQVSTIIELADHTSQRPLLVHVESSTQRGALNKPHSTVRGPIHDVMLVIGEVANHGYAALTNYRIF